MILARRVILVTKALQDLKGRPDYQASQISRQKPQRLQQQQQQQQHQQQQQQQPRALPTQPSLQHTL